MQWNVVNHRFEIDLYRSWEPSLKSILNENWREKLDDKCRTPLIDNSSELPFKTKLESGNSGIRQFSELELSYLKVPELETNMN